MPGVGVGVAGVGVGAYHVIAPDYWRVAVDRQLPFDNAQNWWRHVAAEFGVLGAAAVILWSFVVVWLAGMFGLPHLLYGELLFAPLVAIVDIVLVFIVFKGDVRLR